MKSVSYLKQAAYTDGGETWRGGVDASTPNLPPSEYKRLLWAYALRDFYEIFYIYGQFLRGLIIRIWRFAEEIPELRGLTSGFLLPQIFSPPPYLRNYTLDAKTFSRCKNGPLSQRQVHGGVRLSRAARAKKFDVFTASS